MTTEVVWPEAEWPKGIVDTGYGVFVPGFFSFRHPGYSENDGISISILGAAMRVTYSSNEWMYYGELSLCWLCESEDKNLIEDDLGLCDVCKTYLRRDAEPTKRALYYTGHRSDYGLRLRGHP